MPTMKDLVLEPLGLITRPNKHGQYPPGALSTAQNVAFREPGILSSLPATRSLATSIATSIQRVTAVDTDRFLFCASDAMKAIDGAVVSAVTRPPELPSATWTFSQGGVAQTTHFAKTRNRALVTSDQGVSVFDLGVSLTAPRMAGLPRPALTENNAVTTNALSMAASKRRNCRAVIVRKLSAEYWVVSEVSNVVTLVNDTVNTVNPSLRVTWKTAHGVVAGDTAEIYRTQDVASSAEPGATYYLAAASTITSTDVANGYADVIDTSTSDTLQDELYTNPGQEGLTQTSAPPPYALDVCAFKGHAFYVSRKVAASKTLTTRGAYSYSLSTSAERTHGIGRRVTTGTLTNGSADITAVANVTGVVVGQYATSNLLVPFGRVTAVVGATVTVSAVWGGGTGVQDVWFFDVLEYGAGASDFFAMIGSQPPLDVGSGSATISVMFDYAPLLGGGHEAITGAVFQIRKRRYAEGTFTLRATNGANYIPELPDIAETAINADQDERKNRVHWSKEDKPEAVPDENYFFVGTGEIHRIIPTRDAIYAFCSDGLYRIGGSGGEWRVDPLDRSLVLVSRGAVCELNDVVYALTNRGLVVVEQDSVRDISRDLLDFGTDGAEAEDAPSTTYVLEGDPKHQEVWICTVGGTVWVYNAVRNAFTTFADTYAARALAYSRGLKCMTFAGLDGGNALLRYFYEDTDTGNRMGSADVRFQPFSGDGDPHSLKQFVDLTMTFEGFSAATATLLPRFGATNYTARTVPLKAGESRCRVSVPRAAPSLATDLRPGFTFTSGATAQAWSLRGVRVRWVPGSEEHKR